MEKRPFLAAVGDNCVDYYVQTQTGYPGGNPVNVAVYFTRLGGRAAYVGAVGTDEGGRLIRNGLREKNVDISHVHIEPGATAVTRVELRDGDRVFSGYDEGVMAGFDLSEGDLDFICAADLAVGGISGHAERYFSRIRGRGIPTAFDFSDEYGDPVTEKIFPYVDLAFFSYGGDDVNGFLRQMRAKGPAICVATLGADGSAAYDGRRFYRQGIVPCRVVDTMGAGDSFIAGFLYGYLEGLDIPDCMASGARCSAVTLTCRGAW